MSNIRDDSELQLKEQLKAELDSPEPNRAKVLDILNQLEQDAPVNEIPVDVLKAWRESQLETPKPKNHVRKALVAVAAVFVLMILVVPPVLGAENIFQLIGRWNDSIFSFGKEVEQPESEFKTEHAGLQKLYDAVQDMELSSNVVPTWLPEEYVLEEIIVRDHPEGKIIIASFSADEDYVIYKIRDVPSECNTEYQKDAANAEVHECFGIKHYILSNDDGWNAMWSLDGVVCSISAKSYDLLLKTIASIYSVEE